MSPNIEIRGYLQDTGFLHVSHMLGGYKLNSTFISAMVERWKSETHTFHLLCKKCTITLNDVVLQLGLLVDGLIVTGSGIVLHKKDLCDAFFGVRQRTICLSINPKVEPRIELCGTTGATRRYPTVVRSTLRSQV
ncbi:hypothetical protein J1N35_012462 [Gossypium stocksii]|uniref:Aminotransferase-like plant mobile domain-containing protein n=1 Tax=Gossypium stocksii TaxID=47602 RepID=A0A9D3W473_9ROSI|nr:hypothetical protein J1N35_012462 [Gossypium stocksii]